MTVWLVMDKFMGRCELQRGEVCGPLDRDRSVEQHVLEDNIFRSSLSHVSCCVAIASADECVIVVDGAKKCQWKVHFLAELCFLVYL